ncbi:hypothetical protein Tco_1400849 [Tanacetum coccineum]
MNYMIALLLLLFLVFFKNVCDGYSYNYFITSGNLGALPNDEQPIAKIKIHKAFIDLHHLASVKMDLVLLGLKARVPFGLGEARIDVDMAHSYGPGYISTIRGWVALTRERLAGRLQCYTEKLDALRRWREMFFWVDDALVPWDFAFYTQGSLPRDERPPPGSYRAESEDGEVDSGLKRYTRGAPPSRGRRRARQCGVRHVLADYSATCGVACCHRPHPRQVKALRDCSDQLMEEFDLVTALARRLLLVAQLRASCALQRLNVVFSRSYATNLDRGKEMALLVRVEQDACEILRITRLSCHWAVKYMEGGKEQHLAGLGEFLPKEWTGLLEKQEEKSPLGSCEVCIGVVSGKRLRSCMKRRLLDSACRTGQGYISGVVSDIPVPDGVPVSVATVSPKDSELLGKLEEAGDATYQVGSSERSRCHSI